MYSIVSTCRHAGRGSLAVTDCHKITDAEFSW
jgi:hypothetical protein